MAFSRKNDTEELRSGSIIKRIPVWFLKKKHTTCGCGLISCNFLIKKYFSKINFKLLNVIKIFLN